MTLNVLDEVQASELHRTEVEVFDYGQSDYRGDKSQGSEGISSRTTRLKAVVKELAVCTHSPLTIT
jgi:hypothetical protein